MKRIIEFFVVLILLVVLEVPLGYITGEVSFSRAAIAKVERICSVL